MSEADPVNIDFCYVISHGFAARMLLQTGLLLKLAEQGSSIAILTPDPSDENLLDLKKHPRIYVYDTEIKHTIWDDDYGVKRMYYLEKLRSNPVFWEKHLYSIFYTKSKHPWKRIRPFYYYIIHWLIGFFPSIRERFKRTEDKHLVSKKAQQILQQISPRVLVSTYPINFLEAKYLFAAKQQGIHTVIHLLSWDNVTSKGIFPVIPNRFVAWGNVMREEIKEYYGIGDELIYPCGVPHFDHHLKVKATPNFAPLLQELNLNPTQPYIFYAMSSPRFAPHEIDIVEWLSKEIAASAFGNELQMIVRPHPQNVQGSLADRSWIKRLDNLCHARVQIDYPQLNKSKVRWSMKASDMDHLSNLLAGCSVCINSGSTVSIDALVMDKPVVLSSFDGEKDLYYWKSARRLIDYPHQRKFVDFGGVSVVHSYEELKNQLVQYLEDPTYNQALRQKTLFEECGVNDGQATERVVRAMQEIIATLTPAHA